MLFRSVSQSRYVCLVFVVRFLLVVIVVVSVPMFIGIMLLSMCLVLFSDMRLLVLLVFVDVCTLKILVNMLLMRCRNFFVVMVVFF